MSYIKEKVAYLRGLYDGLDMGDDAQSRLMSTMIDTMDCIADAVDENETSIDELDECVMEIMDFMDEYADLYDSIYDELDDEDFEEDDFVEIQCSHCGDIIYFDEAMLSARDDLICPSCNKKLDPQPDLDA